MSFKSDTCFLLNFFFVMLNSNIIKKKFLRDISFRKQTLFYQKTIKLELGKSCGLKD